jgi:hypothetical protein
LCQEDTSPRAPIHEKRGNAICSNRVVVRHEIVEGAILSAISEVLDEPLLARALDKALDCPVFCRPARRKRVPGKAGAAHSG